MSPSPCARGLTRLSLVILIPLLLASLRAPAQSPPGEVTCKPAIQRTGDLGCWVISDQPVGALTAKQAFWHLDTFPSAEAATAAKGPRGTVLTALGKVWLFTIEDATWQPPSVAHHVATIGPLPLGSADRYAAQYMEATFSPGMKSSIHMHPGTEAIYTESGESCMETSAGVASSHAGGPPIIIPAGRPMQLVATGTQTRRSVVLILHDAAQPAVHPVHDWVPKGLCHN